MRHVLDDLTPSVILTLGNTPLNAIKQIDTGDALVIAAPDPQSTFPMTLTDLRGTASALRKHLDNQPAQASTEN